MTDRNDVLPPGWAEALIDEVLAPLHDGRTLHQGWSPRCEKEPSPSDDEWGVLKTTAIQDGEFLPKHNKRLPDTLEPRPKLEVEEGDILITCAGPRIRCGVPCLVRETRPKLMMSGKMYRFRAPDGIDPSFFEGALRSPDLQRAIDEIKTGIDESGLNLTHARFRGLVIPIAPSDEQRRIVSKIESLQERTARARRALSEVGPLLEQFRQSVLRAAFSGRLTADWRAEHPDVEPGSELLARIRTDRRHRWEQSELAKYEAKGKKSPPNWQDKYKEPAVTFDDDVSAVEFGVPVDTGWEVAPLELLVDPDRSIPYGIVKTGDPFPDGIPTVRCGDIKRFSIAIDRLKQVDPAVHERYRRTWLEGGEVLIAIRGTVGETAVVPDEMKGMNISREVALIPVLPGVESRFLMYLLASPAAQRLITGQVKGVAQAGINLADLRLLPTPLPSFYEQTEIADRIDQALNSIDQLRRSAEALELSLTKLDQSILAKAFSGELVPQDPSDEPASELLARIQEAREAGSKKPRKGGRKKAAKAKPTEQDAPVTADLLEILHARGRMHIDDLQTASDLPSKEFYSRLKDAIASGTIREEFDENKDCYLEPAK